MDDFLNEYIEMVADSENYDLDNDTLHDIICDVENNDEIWNLVDAFIFERLEQYGVPFKKEEPCWEDIERDRKLEEGEYVPF